MSLIDFTHGKFVKAISTANNTTFSMNDVMFSKPRVNSKGYLGGNSLIRLLPRHRESMWDGSAVFGYDRVDLAVLANAVGGQLPAPAGITDPYALLPYFHQHFGIGIASQDLTAVLTEVDAVRTLTLTAGADNAYFLGSVNFTVVEGPALIETPYTYDPLVHIQDDGSEFAETYRWPLNMTTVSATMQTLTVNTVDFKALAVALQTVTGDNWVFSGVAPYSLENAIVRKVGLAQTAWGVSTGYTYAAVVELSPSCTALQGNLLLHFN